MQFTNSPIERILKDSSMEFHNVSGFQRAEFNNSVSIRVVSSDFHDVETCTVKESYSITFSLLVEEWLKFKRGAFMRSIVKQGAEIKYISQTPLEEHKVEINYIINIVFRED